MGPDEFGECLDALRATEPGRENDSPLSETEGVPPTAWQRVSMTLFDRLRRVPGTDRGTRSSARADGERRDPRQTHHPRPAVRGDSSDGSGNPATSLQFPAPPPSAGMNRNRDGT